MTFKTGECYICTCYWPSCSRYYQVIGINVNGMLEVIDSEGKEDSFHVGEAEELLVKAEVFHSPLYKALA